MSRADPHLIAGALVGSTAGGRGDTWSDLDLTFGVADGAAIDDVLADWRGMSGIRVRPMSTNWKISYGSDCGTHLVF